MMVITLSSPRLDYLFALLSSFFMISLCDPLYLDHAKAVAHLPTGGVHSFMTCSMFTLFRHHPFSCPGLTYIFIPPFSPFLFIPPCLSIPPHLLHQHTHTHHVFYIIPFMIFLRFSLRSLQFTYPCVVELQRACVHVLPTFSLLFSSLVLGT